MPKSKTAKRGHGERTTCCGPDCCSTTDGCCGVPFAGNCQVDAVVGLDGRGQMVLPKEVRERFGLKGEEKLAVVTWVRDGNPCCLTLLKVAELADAVRRTYGPILAEIVR